MKIEEIHLIDSLPAKLERFFFYFWETCVFVKDRITFRHRVVSGPRRPIVKKIWIWRERFYRSIAGAETWSFEECYRHTLRKYRGTRPYILWLYGLRMNRKFAALETSEGNGIFGFGTNGCSLCAKTFDDTNSCSFCPLAMVSGSSCMDENSAYRSFAHKHDPEEIILAMNILLRADIFERGGDWPKILWSRYRGTDRYVKNRTLEMNK